MFRKNPTLGLERYNGMFPGSTLYKKLGSNENVFTTGVRKNKIIMNEEMEIKILAYFEAFRENIL